MVALLNADRITERFGDIDSAKLSIPIGSDVLEYLIDDTDEDTLDCLLAPVRNPEDGSFTIESVSGRQIIAEPTLTELSAGLLTSLTYLKGLYTTAALVSVTLKGQVGGVYVVYKFKAV